ncbi:hypothetical protein GHT06_010425 [Daphnia sinensis]|uniref:Chromatin assembly factor 1 subunit A n=1 Tax=Daphnia sinensis TaxID=1820382 RepID=A0AAD5KY72_9CRUS|nr:hypothetical protein GHT06_010425 [Daphnia sinensis]
MSKVADIPETGNNDGRSPKTPRGKKLVQGRLSFTAIDNKTAVPKVKNCKTSEVSSEAKDIDVVAVVDNNLTSVEVIEIDDISKHHSLRDDSDESNSIPNVSLAEGELDSELDTSHVSNDELGKSSSSANTSTPRQAEQQKKKLERLREKEIKENMKLAPTVRSDFDSSRRDFLDQILKKPKPTTEVNCLQYKGNRGRNHGATWPIIKDTEVEVIDEDEAEGPMNKEDIITVVPALPRRMRPKLLKFCENRRPAYWGTWGKTSHLVGPRRPFGKENIFDYDVDSDDEWEEEVEPGESLTDSEAEGEEKEPADDYEVDNEFLVPHGYLSDEEGEKEDDERPMSPSEAKEKLKLKEEQFERELKEKTCHIKPSLIGCCWTDDLNHEPQLLKVLQRYATVVLSSANPIRLSCSELLCENGESPIADETARSENKASKRLVSEHDIPALIRLLHGNSYSKLAIVKEFQSYLERNRTDENKNAPSKAQILAKIAEIASWTKCTETGTMNGRTCWLVQPDVLDHYDLKELSVINAWEFATETKKRGRKADDSRTEEDTPPAKTPRVSLIKQFAQPANLSLTNKVTTSSEKDLPGSGKDTKEPCNKPSVASTPQTKKRIALISIPCSGTKKPKTESKSTPLTNFLKKMSTKEALIKSSNEGDADMDGVECLTTE